ncbi:YugN family protein, partial [Paenibacillus darwinianus]
VDQFRDPADPDASVGQAWMEKAQLMLREIEPLFPG